jgi:hypothetical protein
MKNTKYIGTAVILSTLFFNQAPSFAQFRIFDQINRTLQQIDGTVNNTSRTIENTKKTTDNLGKVLGVSNSSNSNIFDMYAAWYKGLSPSDKEVVSFLVMEYAQNKMTSFEQFSQSNWFKQKDMQGQQQAGALFFKFNEVVNATGSEKTKFLAFAFCVNSGQQNCQ